MRTLRWPRSRAAVASAIGLALVAGASRAQLPAGPPERATAAAALEGAAAAVKKGDLDAARRLLTEFPAPPGALSPEIEARRSFQLAVVDQLEAEQGSPDRQRLLQSAAAGYKRVLEIKPGAVSALYNLGRVHEQLGDVERASKAYQMAAEPAGKEQAYYLRQWADFLAAGGRWRDAEEAYARLVVLEPRLEEPHALLVGRFLEQGKAGKPEALLRYLWRLVEAAQPTRAADLAVTALRGGWPAGDTARELLTVVAASLGARTLEPGKFLNSSLGRQLAALADSPTVGEGVRQLLALYQTPGQYPLGFKWWDRGQTNGGPAPGVSPRDALRAAMRRVGEWYEEQGNVKVAAACYETAVGLSPQDPDPVALRELATLYIERGDLQAVNQLAARHANLDSAFFAAKNQAYSLGQLEKVLEYHRTLGQIYGYLALNGKAGWGDGSQPASAVFQLERAFRVSKKLDDERAAAPIGKLPPLRLDANLTDLLATAYVATGKAPRGNEVRLEAARRFIDAGEPRAKERVLEGIREDSLTSEQKNRFIEYKGAKPPPAVKDGPKASAVKPSGSQWGKDVAYVSNSVKTVRPLENATDAVKAPARKVEPPAVEDRTLQNAPAVSQSAKSSMRSAVVTLPRQIEVPASASWVDTGIDLTAGREFMITASGQWSNAGPPAKGPGGFDGYLHPGTVLATAPLAALIGKVGEAMFAVGERFAGMSPASGRLYLSINDTPGTFGDNQGVLKVTITVK